MPHDHCTCQHTGGWMDQLGKWLPMIVYGCALLGFVVLVSTGRGV